MVEKRNPSVITIKNNFNYDNNCIKQFQRNNKDFILKNSFNTKMNNSISFGNNFHMNKGSSINFQLKNNILNNDLKNLDNKLNEFTSQGIDLL